MVQQGEIAAAFLSHTAAERGNVCHSQAFDCTLPAYVQNDSSITAVAAFKDHAKSKLNPNPQCRQGIKSVLDTSIGTSNSESVADTSLQPGILLA